MAIHQHNVIASNRFGFGARPGDLQQIGAQPKQWLLAQIQAPPALSSAASGVPHSKTVISDFLELRQRRHQQGQNADGKANVLKKFQKTARLMRPIYLQHVMARGIQAIDSDTPFYERLVHFWSNHFAVSADKPQLFGLVGTLEFEAVRPHVSGYFSDMLMAVEKHPAMLTYLDNFQSVGPNSELAKRAGRRGRKRKFDINENLAREILELHTLGVNGGYSQGDVTTFAKVISGWTYGGLFPGIRDTGEAGEFAFNEFIHEPGTKNLLGKQYSQRGIKQGEAVLRDLALHPATARHLAGKLARHFVADEPSAQAIEVLSKAYLRSQGYLPAMYEALIHLDELWQQATSKYKSPVDYVYSIFRAMDFIPEQAQQLLRPLTILGQAPFRPGSPAGWPDTATAWSGGEALFKRIELAVAVANKAGNRVDPPALAMQILGSTMGEQSRLAISRADSAAQGLALLFASPEFQRR